MRRRGRPRYPDILTPREWDVLELLRQGLSNPEIASKLGIGREAVKSHVSEILDKLGVSNRGEAAAWRPEETRRPWPTAFAPLLSWGRLGARWLSIAVGGTLAVAIATAIGFLVWALAATGGSGELTGIAALPRGDRVAYIGADGNLWLLDTNGPLRKLTTDGHAAAPYWTNNGGVLVYDDVVEKTWDYPSGGPNSQLGGVSQDGRLTRVAPKSGATASIVDGGLALACAKPVPILPSGSGVQEVLWSPDGRLLAVAIAKRPNAPSKGAIALDIPQDNGIYLSDGCSGSLRPLLLWPAMRPAIEQAFPAEAPGSTPVSNLMYGPSELEWSPDGQYLLFQPALLSNSGTNDIGGVFSVPVAGGEPVYHGPMLHTWSLLDWFPGGHRFAFTLGEGRDMYWHKRIAVAEAGVLGARVVAEDPDRVPGTDASHTPMSARSDAWPVVSPDGTRIVFQASEARTEIMPRLDVGKIEGPKEGIWIVNADGSKPRQLTSDPQFLDFFPQWSADGQSILFVRTNGSQYVINGTVSPDARAEIWIMHADGSDAQPIVNDLLRIASYYGLFSWNSDLAWYRAAKR